MAFIPQISTISACNVLCRGKYPMHQAHDLFTRFNIDIKGIHYQRDLPFPSIISRTHCVNWRHSSLKPT